MSKNNSPDHDDHASGHDAHAEVPKDAIPQDSLQDKFLILAGVACLAGLLFVIVQWGGIQLPEVHEGGEPAAQTAPKSSESRLELAPQASPGSAGSIKSSEVTPTKAGQNASDTQAPNATEKPVPVTTPNDAPVAAPGAPPQAQTQPAIPAPTAPAAPAAPAQSETTH